MRRDKKNKLTRANLSFVGAANGLLLIPGDQLPFVKLSRLSRHAGFSRAILVGLEKVSAADFQASPRSMCR